MKTRPIVVLKLAVAASIVYLLAGCQSAQDRPWQKSTSPQSQSQHDLAECTYQAESATATIGTGGHPKSTSEAVGDGIADGIESGIEQSELISRCMQAHGYQQ